MGEYIESEYQRAIKAAYSMLSLLGHRMESESMAATPKRLVDYLSAFRPSTMVNSELDFKFTTFKAEGNGMIIETGIPFSSLCEHHCAPFFGRATIAYLPKDRMAGLSKLPRLLNFFAQRFQTQERITSQVADRLMAEVDAKGVGVILRAQHTCMSVRGVKVHGTWTITTELRGAFKEDATTRAEFMQHHNHSVQGDM